MKRRGLALILVVAVLGILAVLGSAFAVLTRLERRAAGQRVLGTKAQLLARSGLEDAQARLDAGQDPAYGGEDFNNDGVLTAGPETAGQVYQPARLDREDCPSPQALRPSFFKAVGGNPRIAMVDGRPRGYSGAFSADGASWSLRVLPEGGFFVNGGDPASPVSATTDYNLILRGMLGTLAEAVDREDGVDDGIPVDQTDGWSLVSARPPAGWRSWQEVRSLALGGSAPKLAALRPYLCLQAWVDRKVIRPNVTAVLVNKSYSGWTTLRIDQTRMDFGSFVFRGPAGRSAPGFERIGARIVGRAPVDLAWARTRRPALIALLAGLRGLYLDETTVMNSLGTLRDAVLALNWASPTDDCRTAAASILASTSELRTWSQWNEFCDSLPMTGATTDLRQAKRDLLKANFNPNTDLNKLNPDPAMARLVDKTDLLSYSTELNLLPRGGWRVSAAGRVLDRQGRLLSLRILSTDLGQDGMARLTTQGELAAGDLGSLELAGDEGAPRALGSDPYITESQGFTKTFGQHLTVAGGYLNGSSRGISLQTVPEPWVSAPAAWDGQLRLATLETAQGEDYQLPSLAGSMKLRAGWGEGLDADYASGGNTTAVSGACLQAPSQGVSPFDRSTLPAPGSSVWDPAEPNAVLPDGAHFELTHIIGYRAPGSFATRRGIMTFWMKPAYDESKYGGNGWGGRLLMNTQRWNGVSPVNVMDMMNCATAAHSLYWMSGAGRRFFMFHTEGDLLTWGEPTGDDPCEQISNTPPGTRVQPHRWYLMTLFWALDQADRAKMNRLLMDRGRSNPLWPEERNAPLMYGTPGQVGTVDWETLACGPGMPATIWLGPGGLCRNNTYTFERCYPDATYDELAIYDFGSDVDQALIRTDTLARNRYEAGRCYKESEYPATAGLDTAPGPSRSAGEWFSAPLDLGTSRLRTLAWTQIVPRTLRGPGPGASPAKPEDGDDGPDGRIGMELADPSVQVPPAAGASYWRDCGGRALDRLFLDSRGEGLGGLRGGAFRLHAVFQPNVADPLGKAVLEPLVLDDVTVVYRDAIRPLASAWREGEE